MKSLNEAVYPLAFAGGLPSPEAEVYLGDPAIQKLVDFFTRKGLEILKEEDRLEKWYEDWLAYQAGHRLYATLLSPRQYSSHGSEFDLLRLTRFLEVFAYFSPAHGYSFQVSFLGLFCVLMGTNADLKREAVETLERGCLLAFGISEKQHGSDLFGNEFLVMEPEPGRLVANGGKYYIGNANSAAMITLLARKESRADASARSKRMPFVLFALRPQGTAVLRDVRKIRTIGVRSAFVGAFEVKDHPVAAADVIAEGRDAWDAVFGTVTLGKFFLGFGSIGICEHALAEAAAHLGGRTLYGKPALDMAHLRSTTARAYARLAAMKLYAYRALDYVRSATDADRRYLLFNAVQKAKVSTEGVRVMALLSECVGAKGLESDTYFEMALRDIQLIPGLEGSTHLNLGLTAQFIPRYFATRRSARPGSTEGSAAPEPASLASGEVPAGENPYLMEARTGALHSIAFLPYLNAYRPLASVPNVRVFAGQVRAFALFLRHGYSTRTAAPGTEVAIDVGRCAATIAYGQLVAENARILETPEQLVSAMFDGIISDLSVSALALASAPGLGAVGKLLIQRVVAVARTRAADWDFVAAKVCAFGRTN